MAPLRTPADFTEMDFYNLSTQPYERHHLRHRNHPRDHARNHLADISNSIMEVLNTKFVPENALLPDMEPLSTHMETFEGHERLNITMNRSELGVEDEFIYRHGGAMTAVYCVAYLLVFIVGLVGNLFVIAVVYRSPRMRTVTNFFIVNLAVADVLVIVFCLPATLMSNIFVREYSFLF
ncbi:unnamed protein product [Leptidea sinapis]|uniref:G-protein coupled receptors family 1 profile domain-containing protein n=1 Tax=Leptidea sinapis TaxID=189913 RepID=A0A5E4PYP0_9NEOP|nr:unnamed protein product [Leptidea sinapis]